ncbi:MAG: hypothetical protein HOH95_14880, partial [Dehalococcoidia bacterium]|nr:hypothetical protein [Dehalococcoidia bacterium]
MSESREHPATPWYQRPIWIVVLLIVLFPVGLFLMWRYADWQPRTKKIVTSLWVWPMAVWWLWKGGRSRWEIGLASFAGLIWLVIVAGVFAG